MKLSRSREPRDAGSANPGFWRLLPLVCLVAAGAAGRTCTTSRRRSRCATACSSRTDRARGRSSRTRSRAARCRTMRRSSPAKRRGRAGDAAVPADRGRARSRRAALQHLLHAVPRPTGSGRRHDRAPRLPAAAVVPHRPAAAGADRAFLRRDDQRLRRDARLPRADRAARSLGDRRLRARAAIEPARVGRRRAGRGAAEALAASAAAAADGRASSTNDRHNALTTDRPAASDACSSAA